MARIAVNFKGKDVNGDKAVNLGRHAAECKICSHPEREEIERDFINWRSPGAIAKRYGLKNRASVYRHAHALGLFSRRSVSEMYELEKGIEHAREVEERSDFPDAE